MHTFYVPSPDIRDDIMRLAGSEQHHLRNVLRLKPGEVLRIMDGKGNVYRARLLETGGDRRSSAVRVLNHEYRPPVSPTLTLFQGLPKNDKMEMILQKTAELGVAEIVPMLSAYALQNPGQNRYKRWERILIAAMKQSARTWLPELREAQTFESSLAGSSGCPLRLFLTPEGGQGFPIQPLKSVLRDAPRPAAISLFVGPEGGFSDSEAACAVESGCTLVTLGSNILRAETAAIVAVAIAAYEFER